MRWPFGFNGRKGDEDTPIRCPESLYRWYNSRHAKRAAADFGESAKDFLESNGAGMEEY